MSISRFKKQLEEWAPRDLKSGIGLLCLKAAIAEILTEIEKKDTKEEVIKKVFARAREMKKEYASEKEALGIPTPSDFITSEILLKKIAHWVQELRRKGFGTSEPPFSSCEEAIRWLEETSQKDKKEYFSRFSLEEVNTAWEQIKALACKYGFSIKEHHHFLPYPGPDGWQRLVPVWPRTYLSYLEYETRQMANATGFSQALLVMYVLTGRKPLLSRCTLTKHLGSYTLPTGEKLTSSSVTLTIRAKDITFEELRSIYEQVKDFLIGKRSKGAKLEAWELFRLVEKYGGIPSRGKTEFWEKIRKEWNASHPEQRYNTWQGVRKAYLGLWERLANPEKER